LTRPVRPCRICGAGDRTPLKLLAQRPGRAREWRIEVCRDCWRVFEAMLDQGAAAVQQDLAVTASSRHALWFL